MGIETSCDETSVAIIEQKKTDGFGYVLAENTLSQVNKHNKFGGIVPELASRDHVLKLVPLLEELLNQVEIQLLVCTPIISYILKDEILDFHLVGPFYGLIIR